MMHEQMYNLKKIQISTPSDCTNRHDDVIKWKHFPHFWPFVRGIHHKGQWRGALEFLWSAPEQTVEHTIETTVIWDAISHNMTSS